MKEANTFINSVIYLHLFLPNIFGGPICKTGNPVTDDIKLIDELVGNLPSDYKIQIKYISKVPNVTDTCWLHLTVPEMSFSLDGLLEKFAKNSSNYLIIENLHRVLDGIHNCLSDDKDYQEESEFNCEKSNLEPKQYFNYFSEIITAFQSAEDTNPCDAAAVCRTMEPPDAGRGSNSTAHTLEQTNKTRAPKCERTHPELVRAKRHSLTAKQPTLESSDPDSFKGHCTDCIAPADYVPVIGISIVCTVIITVFLTCLFIRVQKNCRRNRRNRNDHIDIEQKQKREENALEESQFIHENQDPLT
ncbi:kit ligand a isoform X1 [Carcharodon carcharias]|uniref:kit ligand a isoform X1 n=1 Tax=Carcharodon carcharias TaxID=13397 RepID=UPI001B7F3031|nr:kit ligand a isoform X1 [Carcharodon carcharias]XP_041072333.1 kit ligand a isoform X1 [Carcharodon carcharias]